MGAFGKISLALVLLAALNSIGVTIADEAAPPAPPEAVPSEAAPPQLAMPKVALNATSLYAPKDARLTCLITSPDARRYAALYGGTLVIDGKEIADYDIVRQPVFSPDSQHCAFAGISVSEQKCYIVTDGAAKDAEGFAEELAFSPDSKRLAYITRLDGKYCLVVDGVKGKLYDAVMPLMLQSMMKTDSKVVPQGIFFSPDSQHVVYAAMEGGKYLVVLDGKENGPYDSIALGIPPNPLRGSTITAHAEHLLYHVYNDKKACVILDGQVSEYKYVGFSPDGARVACTLADSSAKTARVIVDGQEGPQYKQAGLAVFSPDSKRVAYWARDDNGDWLVVDGKQYSLPKSDVYDSHPIFSPDSKRVAFTAAHSVLVDDINHNMEAYLQRNIVFSPDSKRIAFRMTVEFAPPAMGANTPKEKMCVAIDFIAGPNYESLGAAATNEPDNLICFSPDSKHVAYFGKRDNDYFAVVDGTETLLDLVPYTQPVFDSPTKFHFIGLKGGNEVVLVEAEITD